MSVLEPSTLPPMSVAPPRPIIGLNGATIIGGNIEGSNTDIAEEFSKMIVTQQAYAANTRVVSTSQQMLTDVLNMVR